MLLLMLMLLLLLLRLLVLLWPMRPVLEHSRCASEGLKVRPFCGRISGEESMKRDCALHACFAEIGSAKRPHFQGRFSVSKPASSFSDMDTCAFIAVQMLTQAGV